MRDWPPCPQGRAQDEGRGLSYTPCLRRKRRALPLQAVAAHAGPSAGGAGEPPAGEGVIALDVFGQRGHKARSAVRADVITGAELQHRRAEHARGGGDQGQRDHSRPRPRRDRQEPRQKRQGDHRDDRHAPHQDGERHRAPVLLRLLHEPQKVFLRLFPIARLGDRFAREQVVDRDVQHLAQRQEEGDLRKPPSGFP